MYFFTKVKTKQNPPPPPPPKTGPCLSVLSHQLQVYRGSSPFLPCWGGSCAKHSCRYEVPRGSWVSLSSCQCSCLYPPQTCLLGAPVKPWSLFKCRKKHRAEISTWRTACKTANGIQPKSHLTFSKTSKTLPLQKLDSDYLVSPDKKDQPKTSERQISYYY